jgi:hypothetical protein
MLRIPGILLLSIGGGVLVGWIAATTVSPIAAPFGAAFGMIVGVAVSPLLLATLRNRPLIPSALIILPPSLAVAFLSGLSGNPLITMFSVIVFCAMAVVASQVLPAISPPTRPGHCHVCDYERGDLPRCPECGNGKDDELELKPTPRSRRRLLTAVALGLLIPAVGAGYAAYERHRPRTTAEWIERLGHNDVQIQWEARQALMRRGQAPLIQAMTHPKAGVRRNAALALGVLGDPSAREVLEAALNDPDWHVQKEAERALEKLAGR